MSSSRTNKREHRCDGAAAPPVRCTTVWSSGSPTKVEYVRKSIYESAILLMCEMLHHGRKSWTEEQRRTFESAIEEHKRVRDGR